MALKQEVIAVEIKGDKKLQAAIDNAIRKTGDLRIPFNLIANDFYKRNRIPFGLSGPGKYPDFKNEESRESKERLVGFEYPLLVRYGDLARSLLMHNDRNAIKEVKKTSMELGTKVPYYVHHHYGTKHMKARPVVFIDSGPKESPGRKQVWIQIIQDYVTQVTKGIIK